MGLHLAAEAPLWTGVLSALSRARTRSIAACISADSATLKLFGTQSPSQYSACTMHKSLQKALLYIRCSSMSVTLVSDYMLQMPLKLVMYMLYMVHTQPAP